MVGKVRRHICPCRRIVKKSEKAVIPYSTRCIALFSAFGMINITEFPYTIAHSWVLAVCKQNPHVYVFTGKLYNENSTIGSDKNIDSMHTKSFDLQADNCYNGTRRRRRFDDTLLSLEIEKQFRSFTYLHVC